jgi:uncharacterized protein
MLEDFDDVSEWFGNGGSLLVLLLTIPGALFLGWVNARFKSILGRYLQVPSRNGFTGVSTARLLLERAGILGVRIVPTQGAWVTDHYNPRTKELALSHGIFHSSSVAAVGVAAHEVGHAIQHARKYFPIQLRTVLVPLTKLCYVLGLPALLLGVVCSTALLWTGVALLVGCLLLPVVNLPVEFDASVRGQDLAVEAGIIHPEERAGTEQVLWAAALTYVARTLALALLFGAFILLLSLIQPAAISLGPEGNWQFGIATVIAVLFAICHAQRNRKRRTRVPGVKELNNTGNIHASQGEFVQAIAAFTKALRLDPHNAEVYANRGVCYGRTNQLDEGLADLDVALRLERDRMETYVCRANVRLLRREYDLAISDFAEALSRGGNRATILRDRGVAWLGKGEFAQALAELDESLQLDAGDGVTHNNRAAVLLKLGAYARALADLEQAKRLLPNLPNSYKNLAWLQATCPDPSFRDGSAAVANATRALQLANARPVEWLAILAAAHAETGNFEEAVRLQTHCLVEARPEDQGAMRDRLELYRTGQPYRDRSPGLDGGSSAGRMVPTPCGNVDRALMPGCVFDNTPIRSHSEPL